MGARIVKKITLALLLIIAFISLKICVLAVTSDDVSLTDQEYLSRAQTSIDLAVEFKHHAIGYIENSVSKHMKFRDMYSGMYIDDTGGLVICYKNDDMFYLKYFFEKTLSENSSFLSQKAVEIMYKKSLFSSYELTNTMRLLEENVDSLNIQSLGIIQKDNIVEIGISEEYSIDEILAFLSQSICSFDERIVKFVIESSPLTLTTSYYAHPGTEIKYKWLFWYYDSGTIGFNAYDPVSGKYGVVTNAHVVYGHTNWYNENNKLIGTVTYSTMEDGPVDAAFITFTNSSTVTWVETYEPKLPDGSTTYLSEVLPEQYIVEGAPVYKIGITSGYTSGQILITDYTYYNISYPDGGIYDITNTIKYTNTSQPGDSGGPVWFCEGSRGPGHYLIAINFARDASENGYGIRVSNIVNDFGVIPYVSPY